MIHTARKTKFFIKDFFSICDQIRRKLQIRSHLLKKSLMENFIFCTVTFLTIDNDLIMKYKQYIRFDFGNCVKSVQIRTFFWSVYSCIHPEYRKIRTRKNSVFWHFSTMSSEVQHLLLPESVVQFFTPLYHLLTKIITRNIPGQNLIL